MLYNNIKDLNVSKICLGTMTFGEQNSEEEAHEQIEYAISKGVNFIDTAEMYAVPGRKETQGLTEKFIGSWLAKNKNERKNIILASKVTGPAEIFSYISPNLGFSRPRILEAIENSLIRLQTDYIDIYQLHWPERKTNFFGTLGYNHHDAQWKDNFEECLATLHDLKIEGKIRHWGLSNETPWGIMRTNNIADKSGIDRAISIQNPYNLLNRTFEIGLSEISIREDIGLLAYSPMAFGLLSGKYHKGLDTPNDRINKFSRLSRYNNENCRLATDKYLQCAEKHGISLAQMSLAYVTSRAFVKSNIIGATNMSQLIENIDSIHIELSNEIIMEIEKIHMEIQNPAP